MSAVRVRLSPHLTKKHVLSRLFSFLVFFCFLLFFLFRKNSEKRPTLDELVFQSILKNAQKESDPALPTEDSKNLSSAITFKQLIAFLSIVYQGDEDQKSELVTILMDRNDDNEITKKEVSDFIKDVNSLLKEEPGFTPTDHRVVANAIFSHHEEEKDEFVQQLAHEMMAHRAGGSGFEHLSQEELEKRPEDLLNREEGKEFVTRVSKAQMRSSEARKSSCMCVSSGAMV